MDRITLSKLTPAGRGAVAVLRVQNDGGQLSRHFRSASGRALSTAKIGEICYGHWGAEDVVGVRVRSDEWEIHCHGGDAAVNRIAEDLGGLSQPSPESTSSLYSRLLALLLQCRTQKTARYVLAQRNGVLQDMLANLADAESVDTAVEQAEEALRWLPFASHLVDPWKVAIVGQPNAGKSSLLNAITGFDRSIVFDLPGTTRDRIDVELTLAGYPFQLADTAGIREDTQDSIENQGVESALQSIRECDACLLVVDSLAGWSAADQDLFESIPDSCIRAVVWNKSDLTTAHAPPTKELQADVLPQVISTSATTGEGVSTIISWLTKSLIPENPPLDQPLPLLPEIASLLQEFALGRDFATLSKFRALTGPK